MKNTALVIACLLATSARSQEAAVPSVVPVELLSGHDRLYFQMLVNKGFSSTSRFGFFNVSAYAASYANHRMSNDLISFSSMKYTLLKGFAITAGASMSIGSGFRPLAGVQYLRAGRRSLVLVAPGVYLNGDPDLETMIVVEVRPMLSGTRDLYFRAQMLYNHDTGLNAHYRSYLFLRAGITWNRFSFGVGANLDRYGPSKTFKENYGPFLIARFT